MSSAVPAASILLTLLRYLTTEMVAVLREQDGYALVADKVLAGWYCSLLFLFVSRLAAANTTGYEDHHE